MKLNLTEILRTKLSIAEFLFLRCLLEKEYENAELIAAIESGYMFDKRLARLINAGLIEPFEGDIPVSAVVPTAAAYNLVGVITVRIADWFEEGWIKVQTTYPKRVRNSLNEKTVMTSDKDVYRAFLMSKPIAEVAHQRTLLLIDYYKQTLNGDHRFVVNFSKFLEEKWDALSEAYDKVYKLDIP